MKENSQKEHSQDNFGLALSLAQSGIPVFPCQSRGEAIKRPCAGVRWLSEATTDKKKISTWWQKFPDAIPGINLATTPLMVVDLDGAKGFKDWDLISENQSEVVAPFNDTPSGGRHIWFKRPQGVKVGNSRGNLPPKENHEGIDIRGEGGYVIAPGTILPDGRKYNFEGDATELMNAPELPQWLFDILYPSTKIAESLPQNIVIAPQVALADETRTNAYAQTGFEAELNIVANAPQGGRNNTLNESAFKIGTMVGAGWISEAEAESGLMNAASACGLTKEDGIPSVRATIRSGLKAGIKNPRSDLPVSPLQHMGAQIAARLIETAGGDLINLETGEILSEVQQQKSKPLDEFPQHLLQVPGLVGEIAAWIVSSSRRPQPALSLGSALAIVGTVCGRRISGPTMSGTHLYMIGLAPTGAGKDHPLNACNRILDAAGMKQHVGPSQFISMPAVINNLLRQPLSLCAMDEIDVFIKRINNRRASGFEGAVTGVLRTAWGASFQAISTPEWAGRAADTIYAPAMSIYGVSRLADFYGALEGGDITNGVLNRFLLIETNGRPVEQEPMVDPFTVPDAILKDVQALYNAGGTLAAAQANAQSPRKPKVVPWENEAVRTKYRAFSAEVQRLGDENPEIETFYARSAEIAIRLATIRAIGINPTGDAVLDMASLDWACEFALYSAQAMAKGARDFMSDTDAQGETNKIKRLIKERGRIRHRDLLRAVQYRLKNRELQDVLKNLVEAEEIMIEEVRKKEGVGRPSLNYVWCGG